jgi:hypothetical protein
MNCNNHYTGLGEVPVCDEALILPLLADVGGTWAFLTTFNGAYQYVQFEATASQSLVIPARLNENYTYVFRLYRPNGAILNDTYYCLKTIPMLPDIMYPAAGDPGGTNVISAGRKQFVATDGQLAATFTDIINAVQLIVFIEGSMRQEGADADDYTYDAPSGTVTLNTALQAGQKITILYFK